MMRLTPQDVHDVEFNGSPRFKAGYDEEEVDEFLGEIEAGLSQLFDENVDLQQSLRTGGPPVPPLNLTLTPEDINGKQFTSTKRRPGYNEEEVDAFLDDAENTFKDLIGENGQLRAQLETSMQDNAPVAPVAAQPQRKPPAPPMPKPEPAPAPEPAPEPEPAPPPAPRRPPRDDRRPAPRSRPERRPAPEPAPEPGRRQSEADRMSTVDPYGIDAAARVLALAQRTADEAIRDARKEANEVLIGASRRAEQITNDAQVSADSLENAARDRADALERDAQRQYREVVGSLASQREELERRIEELQATEVEYRRKLKQELQDMLRGLDAERGGSTRAA